MDVFLIPVASDRYELYCEVPDEDPSGALPDHDRGWVRSLVTRFRQALAEFERERNSGQPPPPVSSGLFAHLTARFRRAIAGTVAEQRLLWHMRRQAAARLVHPADLAPGRALALSRARFKADYEKHLLWLMVNGLLFVASGVLAILPGPNVVAYYLAFRVVGHFLAMRGARQAIRTVEWTTEASAPLADLRALLAVAQADRRSRVEAIAGALELEHLVRFFDRVAVPGA
jgi:hypothetical protein